MAALLAEQSEARASGEQRHIFAEIRRLCAVPMVALIYRHLATIPGALEWAWALVGPQLANGQIQQRAWALADAHRVDADVMVTAAALRLAGVDAAQAVTVHTVLAAYNRANPINSLVVCCLALHLQGGADGTGEDAVPMTAWCPPPPLAALPAMIAPDDMAPDLNALVRLLTTRDAAAPPPALWPSLYRHLANWPLLLAYAGLLVPPRFAAIDAQAQRLRAQVQAAARQLAPALRVPPDRAPPSGAQAQALLEAIDHFGARIPEMVLIGGLLARALPAPPTQVT